MSADATTNYETMDAILHARLPEMVERLQKNGYAPTSVVICVMLADHTVHQVGVQKDATVKFQEVVAQLLEIAGHMTRTDVHEQYFIAGMNSLLDNMPSGEPAVS